MVLLVSLICLVLNVYTNNSHFFRHDMRFYLSNTRVGTILHSWVYLFGLPALFEDSFNNLELLDEKGASVVSAVNYGLPSSPSTPERDNYNTTNSSAWPPELELSSEKCYGPWGCFRPKYPNLRGFHLFPDTLEEMNPSVCFYTRPRIGATDRNSNRGRAHGCEWCQIVEEETIRSLNPRPQQKQNESSKSYWIAHGYMENGQRPWIKEMVCELLEADPGSNVFVLDWAEGAKPPYSQAVANLDLLAAYAGKMMQDLEKLYGLNLEEVHVIGHSLGGHLGGFIGKWVKLKLNRTLGRLSGLDPAQPHFEKLPSDARLDSEDATFVDIVHTDARPMMDGGNVGVGLGIQTAIGHADFYPNDGKEQPGCKDGVYNAILLEDGSFLYGIRRFLGCDHMRAYEYFVESIRSSRSSSCNFMAFACPSWNNFVTGGCISGEKNSMGFQALKPSSPKSYYLLTGSKPPFCRNHYIVTINLASESSYPSTSDLHLVLLDDNRKETTILTIDWTELRGGNLTYTYLLDGHSSPSISRLILRPAMSNPLLWFVNRLAPKKPDLCLTSISIRHLEQDSESNLNTFCPETSPSFSISDQNPKVDLLKSTSGSCDSATSN